ncbi:MAG: phosphatase PAP2 family protein [Pseudomonadota bacterium]
MRRAALVLLVALAPAFARGEGTPTPGPLEDPKLTPKHLIGDVTEGVYNSTAHRWNWPAIGIAGGTGLGVFLLNRWVDPKIDQTNTPPRLGSLSKELSRVGQFGPYVVPAMFLGSGFLFPKGSPERAEVFQTTEQLVETFLWTAGATYALKMAVGRIRPDRSNDGSLPSGHAALTFGTAGVIAWRYPWYVGVPALATASAVSFSRVDLNRHFASDVALGAGLGLFFSSVVHFYHERFEPSSTTALLPVVSKGNYGLAWTTDF